MLDCEQTSSGSVACSAAPVASEPVTQSAYGFQRPYAERSVDLFPEVPDVDLDHVDRYSCPMSQAASNS